MPCAALDDDVLARVFMTLPLHVLQYVKRVDKQFRRCARRVICSEEWLGITCSDGTCEYAKRPNYSALREAIITRWTLCKLPAQVRVVGDQYDSDVYFGVLHDLEITLLETEDDLKGDPFRVTVFVLEIPGKGLFNSVGEAAYVLELKSSRSGKPTDRDMLCFVSPYMEIGGNFFPFEPIRDDEDPFDCDLDVCTKLDPPAIVRPDGSAVIRKLTSPFLMQ